MLASLLHLRKKPEYDIVSNNTNKKGRTTLKMLASALWFGNQYSKNDISAHSAQVSFFIMISLLPFALFLLTLIQFTPIDEQTVLSIIDSLTPSTLSPIINNWMQEVYQKSSGTVVSLTIIAALWASSKGFLGIYAGIQKIYGVQKKRNFFQIRMLSLLYTIAFGVMIAISLIVLVYGNKIFLFINAHIPLVGDVLNNIFPFRVLIGFSIFVLFFILIFTLVPERSVKLRTQVPGALVTSILWIVFSFLYSIYIDNFSNMTTLYGSFSYIAMFMLWLFFCINFVFIGAEVNIYLAILRSLENNNE